MKKLVLVCILLATMINAVFEYLVRTHMTLTRYLLLQNRYLEKNIKLFIILFAIILIISIVMFLHKKSSFPLIISPLLCAFQIYELLNYNFFKFTFSRGLIILFLVLLIDISYAINLIILNYKNRKTTA